MSNFIFKFLASVYHYNTEKSDQKELMSRGCRLLTYYFTLFIISVYFSLIRIFDSEPDVSFYLYIGIFLSLYYIIYYSIKKYYLLNLSRISSSSSKPSRNEARLYALVPGVIVVLLSGLALCSVKF